MAGSKDLRIRYLGDASSLKSTMAGIDQASASMATKLQSAGTKISGLGMSLTKGLTLPIVGFGAVAVSEFTEFQQVQGQTAAALKSTGGAANVTAKHVTDLSTRIGNLSAQDGEAVQAGENVLLTFTNIRNEVGKGNKIFDRASIAAADLSARMGTDLKSSMVLVGKALNDPVKGLTALTRVGVSFTDQQKQQIATLVKSGHTMAAQKVILGELTKEFGGSAKAAGAAASPFTKLKLVFLDVAQTAGQFIVPVLQKVAGWFKSLADRFQALSPHAQKVIVLILGIAAAIGPVLVIVGKLTSGIGKVIGIFKTLSSVLKANPYLLIVAATVALAVLIVKNWGKIKAFLLAVWHAIEGAAKAVWDRIKGVILPIVHVIGKVIETEFNVVKAVVLAIWKAMKVAAAVWWFALKNVVIPIVKTIATIVGTEFKILKAVVIGIWQGIKAVAMVVWGAIKTVIINPIVWVKDHVIAVIRTLKGVWDSIWHGIVSVVSGVAGAIAKVVGAAIGWIGKLIGWIQSAINWLSSLASKVTHVTGHGLGGVVNPGGGPGPVPLAAPLRFGSATPRDRTGGPGRGQQPINVIVHVHGSVTAERDLANVIRSQLLQGAKRNGLRVGLA